MNEPYGRPRDIWARIWTHGTPTTRFRFATLAALTAVLLALVIEGVTALVLAAATGAAQTLRMLIEAWIG